MKKETFKDWIKTWSVESIVGYCISNGMHFMVGKMSENQLKKNNKIVIDELKSRIKN